MLILIISTGIIVLSGIASLFSAKKPRYALAFSAGGTILGCLLALIPVSKVLLLDYPTESLRLDWDVPYGAFFIEIDPLSAFFLLPILCLSSLAAIYGCEYLWAYREKKSLGAPGFFFNLLVAGMIMVVIARNAVLFLMAWEIMSLASFFLVTFEDEKESVRQAGWTYLVATHLGTAFLLVMFLLLGRQAGSLDFGSFGKVGAMLPSSAGLLFVLAVIGFGTKAGFMPFHVWLPEAHPAAPSHVSALMSGVMIKTGIYGLVRMLTLLGPPPAWWGWLLIGIGASSGILGVLFALAQHDLKRLLAYHSVENIGIIALGLGVGVLGLSIGSPLLAVLGFGGGLLHVINHALFKGLLFLGAGAVLHSTGTRQIDELGGLLKRMPWTGACFLTGAAAICGLPPLNGFVSEFLIFLGAYNGATRFAVGVTVPMLGVIAGLALIGGLAAACFTKAFGVVFLGEPRSDHSAHAHEPGLAMRIPMALLALGCLFIGLFSPLVFSVLATVIQEVTGLTPATMGPSFLGVTVTLLWVVAACVGFFALVLALVMLRHKLLCRQQTKETITWDCGYAKPSPRMQYTASSFAQPMTDLFKLLLRTRRKLVEPAGIFPREASLHNETTDLCREGIYRPVFQGIERGFLRMRWLQHGRVQIYVLYIALTLLLLLIWNLG